MLAAPHGVRCEKARVVKCWSENACTAGFLCDAWILDGSDMRKIMNDMCEVDRGSWQCIGLRSPTRWRVVTSWS
jgi:hypothetical protein